MVVLQESFLQPCSTCLFVLRDVFQKSRPWATNIVSLKFIWFCHSFILHPFTRLNYVKVSPSVLRAVDRHSATRLPAQCTSLCWRFYGLWLEFTTSLRDSDYKTLVTMLTKAHVISAVVFVVFIWHHIVLLWSYVTVQPSSVRTNGQKLCSRKYCTCLWHISAVQGVPGSNLASVIIHSLLSSPLSCRSSLFYGQTFLQIK